MLESEGGKVILPSLGTGKLGTPLFQGGTKAVFRPLDFPPLTRPRTLFPLNIEQSSVFYVLSSSTTLASILSPLFKVWV